MRKFISAMILGASVLGVSFGATAKAPVVVEMFGMNGCGADMMVQDSVFELLRKHEDVIFVNCRKKIDIGNGDPEMKYTHDFCNERSAEYARRLSFFSERTPMVVVNGKWEAYYTDLDPSVNVGTTDNVQNIDLSIQGDIINISVPEIEGVDKGVLFIYSYAPTQGDETLVVDPDVSLTDDIQKRLAAGQSVPFVTKERLVPYFVRPIVNRVRVADWHGGVFQTSYPLSYLIEMDQGMVNDLSYVAVLHKGDDYGAIVAAGEVMAPAEKNSILLHSKAPEIELRSNPNPEVINSQ